MPTKKASPQRKPHHREDEAFHAAEKSYGVAMAFFTKQNWAKARDSFRSFIEDEQGRREFADIVDRARSHLRVCENKLAPPPADPTDAEGWLLAGVAQSNRGDSHAAIESLDRAAAMGAPAARVYYARAAALAVAGRHDEALADLEKAIDGDPASRYYSLTDPDFEDLRETAGYVSLVEPPRGLDGAEFDDELGEDDDDDATGEDGERHTTD